MQLIRVRFREDSDFVKSYTKEGAPGGVLFCPTTTPLEKGARILVEVHFPALPNKMVLVGQVINWRAALPRLRVRAGAQIAFDLAEKEKILFLLASAAGKQQGATRRRFARLPLELPVAWHYAEARESVMGHLRDISVGGAQLVTDERLKEGDDLVLELSVPGTAHPIPIAAKVSNIKPDAYGISFMFRNGGGSRRLKEVFRRLVSSNVTHKQK